MSSRALALPRSGKESADPAMRSARKRVRSPEPGFGRIRAGILSLSVLIMALTGVVVAVGSVPEHWEPYLRPATLSA